MFIVKKEKLKVKSSISKSYIINDDSLIINVESSEVDNTEEKLLDYKMYPYNRIKNKKPYWDTIEYCIVQSRANLNLKLLSHEIFEKNEGIAALEDYCNLFEVLEDLKSYDISNRTFINFVRHFPFLDDYIDHKNYHVSAELNSIRFHIWKNNINLVINFNSNYLIDFFSYDNDKSVENDKLIYSMKGTFSSSSNLRKSYKIERLLSILGDDNKSYTGTFILYTDDSEKSNIKIGSNVEKIEVQQLSKRILRDREK